MGAEPGARTNHFQGGPRKMCSKIQQKETMCPLSLSFLLNETLFLRERSHCSFGHPFKDQSQLEYHPHTKARPSHLASFDLLRWLIDCSEVYYYDYNSLLQPVQSVLVASFISRQASICTGLADKTYDIPHKLDHLSSRCSMDIPEE